MAHFTAGQLTAINTHLIGIMNVIKEVEDVSLKDNGIKVMKDYLNMALAIARGKLEGRKWDVSNFNLPREK